MSDSLVRELREQTRLRAAGRPRVPEMAAVADLVVSGTPAGPDPELLQWAIRAWAGPDPVGSGLSPLHSNKLGMPPTFIAVGALDALRPEAASLAEALRTTGTATEFLVLDHVGHGFMTGGSTPEAAARHATLTTLATFLAGQPSQR